MVRFGRGQLTDDHGVRGREKPEPLDIGQNVGDDVEHVDGQPGRKVRQGDGHQHQVVLSLPELQLALLLVRCGQPFGDPERYQDVGN